MTRIESQAGRTRCCQISHRYLPTQPTATPQPPCSSGLGGLMPLRVSKNRPKSRCRSPNRCAKSLQPRHALRHPSQKTLTLQSSDQAVRCRARAAGEGFRRGRACLQLIAKTVRYGTGACGRVLTRHTRKGVRIDLWPRVDVENAPTRANLLKPDTPATENRK